MEVAESRAVEQGEAVRFELEPSFRFDSNGDELPECRPDVVREIDDPAFAALKAAYPGQQDSFAVESSGRAIENCQLDRLRLRCQLGVLPARGCSRESP